MIHILEDADRQRLIDMSIRLDELSFKIIDGDTVFSDHVVNALWDAVNLIDSVTGERVPNPAG